MVGIYKFTNIKNEIYIGYSRDVENRIKQHSYNHEIKEWEVIEECDVYQLKAKEASWIKHYNSYNKGLNRNKGGGGSLILTDKHKTNISKGRIGIKSKTSKYNPIYQYDLEGNFVKEWHNPRQCSIGLGISNGELHSVLKTRGRRTMKGWRFIKEKLNKLPPTTLNAGKKKKVIQYDKQNTMIKEFESAKYASQELNLYITNITAVCRGELKSTGGFIFKYI